MIARFWHRAGIALAVALPALVIGVTVGSFAGADDRLADVPAAVVNEDEIITQPGPDGEEQTIFAGRQVVTELTSGDAGGFDWQVTNAEQAAEWLADGTVYAVVTIPADFSERVVSLQSDEPRQAGIDIASDGTHDALSPAIAARVGEAIAGSLGEVVTSGFVSGVYGGFGTLAEQLGGAADGAGDLDEGAAALAEGLTALADGQAQLATGVEQAAAGADALNTGASSLASGIRELDGGSSQLAAGAGAVSNGVREYTGGVDTLAGGLATLSTEAGALPAALDGLDATALAAQAVAASPALSADPAAQQQAAAVAQYLTAISGAGGPGVDEGVRAVVGGIQQTSQGASQLAAGSAGLRDGAAGIATGASELDGGIGALSTGASQLSGGVRDLADGLDEAAAGTRAAADGAAQSRDGAGALASGTTQLRDGLQQAVEAIPVLTDEELADLSGVAANPVTAEVDGESALGRDAAAVAVPIALWLGAIATALTLGGLARRSLERAVQTRQLAMLRIGRVLPIAGVQTALVTVAAHLLGGVDWALLPATFGIAALLSTAVTLGHVALVEWWGRGGIIVSLALLAVQFVVAGLVPHELLPTPIAALRGALPVPYAVDGLRAVMGATPADAWSAVGALLVWVAVSLVAAVLAVRHARRRSARAVLALA